GSAVLWERRRSRPRRPTVSSTSCFACARSPASAGMPTASPPNARMAAAVASVDVGSRSLTTTRAPSRASATAPARPRPEPAPVTRAMRFARRMVARIPQGAPGPVRRPRIHRVLAPARNDEAPESRPSGPALRRSGWLSREPGGPARRSDYWLPQVAADPGGQLAHCWTQSSQLKVHGSRAGCTFAEHTVRSLSRVMRACVAQPRGSGWSLHAVTAVLNLSVAAWVQVARSALGLAMQPFKTVLQLLAQA